MRTWRSRCSSACCTSQYKFYTKQKMVLAAIFCLQLVALIFEPAAVGVLTTTSSNHTLIAVGDNVTFNCKTNDTASVIRWLHINSSFAIPTTVWSGTKLNRELASRYSVTVGESCHLAIRSVELTDGGTFLYQTSDTQLESNTLRFYLTVYNVTCEEMMSAANDNRPAEVFEVRCDVKYKGILTPTVTCLPQIQNESVSFVSNNSSATYTKRIDLSANVYKGRFTCAVSFNAPDGVNNSAIVYMWNSSVIAQPEPTAPSDPFQNRTTLFIVIIAILAVVVIALGVTVGLVCRCRTQDSRTDDDCKPDVVIDHEAAKAKGNSLGRLLGYSKVRKQRRQTKDMDTKVKCVDDQEWYTDIRQDPVPPRYAPNAKYVNAPDEPSEDQGQQEPDPGDCVSSDDKYGNLSREDPFPQGLYTSIDKYISIPEYSAETDEEDHYREID